MDPQETRMDLDSPRMKEMRSYNEWFEQQHPEQVLVGRCSGCALGYLTLRQDGAPCLACGYPIRLIAQPKDCQSWIDPKPGQTDANEEPR